MKCIKCKKKCVKNGFSKYGIQRYYCKSCRQTHQKQYQYEAYRIGTNTKLVSLLKEGCGTRSISRLLGISANTVTSRILLISRSIKKPIVKQYQEFEMDELFTYSGNKKQRKCIAYAIDRKTRDVVDFIVGRRNQHNLKRVVDTLLLSQAKQIRTDRLNIYKMLIPKQIHHVKKRGINYIERKNLTLRTHIKRLNRRTIAYSKSMIVLSAVLKIYFWHH